MQRNVENACGNWMCQQTFRVIATFSLYMHLLQCLHFRSDYIGLDLKARLPQDIYAIVYCNELLF